MKKGKNEERKLKSVKSKTRKSQKSRKSRKRAPGKVISSVLVSVFLILR